MCVGGIVLVTYGIARFVHIGLLLNSSFLSRFRLLRFRHCQRFRLQTFKKY